MELDKILVLPHWFLEVCFWVNINIIFKQHTEDTFAKNMRKEAIANHVQLAQFLAKSLGQLQNPIIRHA